MNFKSLPLFIVAVVLAFTACSGSDSPKVNLNPTEEQKPEDGLPNTQLPAIDLDQQPLTNKLVAGIYTGTLPCTDCSAIAYRLEIWEDGRYGETQTFVGKSTEPEQTIGTITINKDNTFSLGKFRPGPNRFAKTKLGLLIVNDDGTRIEGPDALRYQLLPEVAQQQFSTRNEELYAQGVSMFAEGSNPAWSLLLNFSEGITLYAPGGKTHTFDIKDPEIKNDNTQFVYVCHGPNGQLTLTIDVASRCQNMRTGHLLDASVTAQFTPQRGKATTYSGCGNFVTFPELFETTWQLAYFNEVAADPKKYQAGLPTLRLGYNQRDFTGTDGCNELGGSYYILGDKLVFAQFASTALSCPNMNDPREFNFAIQGNMYSAIVYDGQLTLTNLKNKLVFIKKGKR